MVTAPPLPSLRQLARRALPQVVEASLVPAGILVVLVGTAGTTAAIAGALGWAIITSVVRWIMGRPVSGLGVLSLTRLSARSVIAIAAGSPFVYFVQGSVGGLCLAGAFLTSVALDRPLARRFARDFAGMDDGVLARPEVHRTLRGISLLWGLVGLAHALVGVWLLVSLPLTTYVVANAVLSVAVPATAAAVSVTWFRRRISPAS